MFGFDFREVSIFGIFSVSGQVQIRTRTRRSLPQISQERITFLSPLFPDLSLTMYSGASTHMAGNQSLLSKVSSKHDSLQVELGDNKRYQVKGTGSISFHLVCNNTLNVLLVPGLNKKLISVSTLEDKGMRIA